MVDYSLTGTSRRLADDRGLGDAQWFVAAVEPKRLRALQRRSDARPALDTLLWLALLVGSGVWAYLSAWSWWSIPAFALYGALYGGAADPRWHEMGHGTAFRSRRANDLVYPIASFMLFRGPTVWRWSHYRHHTDTIIVGRDAEIAFQRPPSIVRTVLGFTGWGAVVNFVRLARHATGRLDPDAADLVPESEHRAVAWESRVFVAIVLAAAAWSIVAGTPLPIMLVGGPSVFGMWLMVFFGLTQHAGLRENVLDHRYSTRTVLMNPVFRFLYLNMNYHVEHHMFPSVPYHALPALHHEIGDQLAPPLPNTWAAYRQVFGTFVRQRRDPSFELSLDVPDVPGDRRHIDVGEASWVRRHDGLVDLGADHALAVGEMRSIDVADLTYVLCRLSEDEVTLADGLCTHARVHLCDGALVDGQIECPKHNARFDARTGAVVRPPAPAPITTYRVMVRDGRLVTDLEPNHETGRDAT